MKLNGEKPSNGSNYLGEIHRLDSLPENFDVEMFNRLYKKTAGLRKGLSYQVDVREFGLDHSFVEGWLSDKFLYVFVKYFNRGEPEEKILASCINSLKLYKYKIINQVYRAKEEKLYSSVNIDDLDYDLLYDNCDDDDMYKDYMGMYKDYMKDILSEKAYSLLKLIIEPPLLMKEYGYTVSLSNSTHNIPPELLASLLSIKPEGIKFALKRLRKEIKNCIIDKV